jgi:hypothetical protein
MMHMVGTISSRTALYITVDVAGGTDAVVHVVVVVVVVVIVVVVVDDDDDDDDDDDAALDDAQVTLKLNF